MSSINGFGTTFYGQCDYELSGSYVATRWVIIAFFPVIPLYSARMYHVHTPRLSMTTQYQFQKVPLNKGQVLRTWGYFIFMLAGLVICISLMTMLGKFFSIGKYLGVVVLIGYLMVMWFLPDYLQYKAKLKAGFDPDSIVFISPTAKKTAIFLGVVLLIFMGFMAFVSR